MPIIRFEKQTDSEHIYIEGMDEAEQKNLITFEYWVATRLVMFCYNAAPPYEPFCLSHEMANLLHAENFMHHTKFAPWYVELIRWLFRRPLVHEPEFLATVNGHWNMGNRNCFGTIRRVGPGHLEAIFNKEVDVHAIGPQVVRDLANDRDLKSVRFRLA